jgi:predicted alpha/beta hydrolase family esterase
MSGCGELHVDVQGGVIIVTHSKYSVTYYKPAKSPQLLARGIPSKNDPFAIMTSSEFLAKAWREANNKARELGWIV